MRYRYSDGSSVARTPSACQPRRCSPASRIRIVAADGQVDAHDVVRCRSTSRRARRRRSRRTAVRSRARGRRARNGCPGTAAKRGTCRYWHDRLVRLELGARPRRCGVARRRRRSRARPARSRNCRTRGDTVVFVTNNSCLTRGRCRGEAARAIGIDGAGAVVSSAMAAADTGASQGERVLVCGGPGIVEALEGRGAVPVSNDASDGAGRRRDGRVPSRLRLRRACGVAATAVRKRRPPDRDATTTRPIRHRTARFPAPARSSPASSAPAGVSAVVAGKPYVPMADLVRRRLGGSGTVVGDRPDTDGRLAAGPRLPVRARAHRRHRPRRGRDRSSRRPDTIAPDLAALVDAYHPPVVDALAASAAA